MTHLVDDDRLTATFAALASTTRRAILARLAQGPASVNELAAPFPLTLPAVSKHIKVLEQAGLVVRARHAQYRPCALNVDRLEEVASWAESYRPIWEHRLDRMEDYLRGLRPGSDGDDHPRADRPDNHRADRPDNHEETRDHHG